MKGKKTGGKDFKKGNPGRPKGIKTVSPEVKEINRKEVEILITSYFKMSLVELGEIAKDKTTPSKDLMVIKIITEAIKSGDQSRFNFLLERTIGKVKDSLDISNPDGSMRSTVIILPANGREKKS